MPSKTSKTPSKKTPSKSASAAKQNTVPSSVAYLTVVGWFIAYFVCKKSESEYEMFHIRQSFGLHMTMFVCEMLGFFSMIPYPLVQILWFVYILACIVFFIQTLRSKRSKVVIL